MMTNRAIRKQMRKLGGKPSVGLVERASHSINTTPREKALRVEQAKELGIHNVPIDPRSVNDPRKWYEGKPLVTRSPEIERMKAERRQAGGDRFRDR